MVSWFTARAAAAPVAADIATASAQVSGSQTLVPNLWARGSGPCLFRSLRGVRGWAMSSEKFEKWVQNAVLVSGPENGPRFIDHKHKSITAGPFLSPFLGSVFGPRKWETLPPGFPPSAGHLAVPGASPWGQSLGGPPGVHPWEHPQQSNPRGQLQRAMFGWAIHEGTPWGQPLGQSLKPIPGTVFRGANHMCQSLVPVLRTSLPCPCPLPVPCANPLRQSFGASTPRHGSLHGFMKRGHNMSLRHVTMR